MATTDALDDAVNTLGAEVPEGKLPTPAEMEALENGAAAEAEKEAAQEEPASEGEPTPELTLEALNEKLESGQELTEEEQTALEGLQKTVEENEKVTKPAKKYTVDKKEFTFDEKEAEMRKAFDIPEDEVIEASRLEKMVDTFVKSQNREAAHVATSERAKQIAEDKKKVEAEQVRIQTEKARLEYKRTQVEQEKARLARMRERLEKKAAAAVTEEDTRNPETGFTDPAKLTQYQDKLRAKEELEDLNNEEKEVEKQEREIEAQALHTSIVNIQLANPQYRTSEDIRVIAQKIQRNEQVTPEDEQKALSLFSMANEAATMQTTLEKIFATRKADHRIMPELAPASAPAHKGPPKSRETIINQVAKLREKIKRNPNLAAPSGGGQRGSGKKRASLQLIEEERAARGDDGDTFAKKGVWE